MLENTDKAVADLLSKLDAGVFEKAGMAFEYLVQYETIKALSLVVLFGLPTLIAWILAVVLCIAGKDDGDYFVGAFFTTLIAILLSALTAKFSAGYFVPEAVVIKQILSSMGG